MADVLVLGGTAWLGREVARQAAQAGHAVTCLARGESGPVPDGVRSVRTDRGESGAYQEVQQDWDLVVDVTRQPGHARDAVAALGSRSRRWTLISTANVYADLSIPLHEDAALRDPLDQDVSTPETYGEGKVACEQAVTALPHHLVLRAGLIVGPGDPSDRGGYWVSRFALAGDEPVLVPDLPGASAQVVDVRDVAAFVLGASLAGVQGVMNVAGNELDLADFVARSAEVARHTGTQVPVAGGWLTAHDVQPWTGERSLPLWLPEGFAGMCRMSTARARTAGLRPRSLRESLEDVLADEQARGLERSRKAGLERADELDLLARV
ncbi:oxidoreductase [Aeromicrobium sp. CTD01-1L150]|uniref:oxidoreductase n=1 Tax=Aeromicrobium sp. CTD01-1L150 TaxID=3341830 RepID=UPI0035C02C90